MFYPDKSGCSRLFLTSSKALIQDMDDFEKNLCGCGFSIRVNRRKYKDCNLETNRKDLTSYFKQFWVMDLKNWDNITLFEEKKHLVIKKIEKAVKSLRVLLHPDRVSQCNPCTGGCKEKAFSIRAGIENVRDNLTNKNTCSHTPSKKPMPVNRVKPVINLVESVTRSAPDTIDEVHDGIKQAEKKETKTKKRRSVPIVRRNQPKRSKAATYRPLFDPSKEDERKIALKHEFKIKEIHRKKQRTRKRQHVIQEEKEKEKKKHGNEKRKQKRNSTRENVTLATFVYDFCLTNNIDSKEDLDHYCGGTNRDKIYQGIQEVILVYDNKHGTNKLAITKSKTFKQQCRAAYQRYYKLYVQNPTLLKRKIILDN